MKNHLLSRLALMCLIFFSAMGGHTDAFAAQTQCEPWPRGCGSILKSCEGWMCHYGNGDANATMTNEPSVHYFVYSAQQKAPYDKADWASNIDDARTLSDSRILKK